MMTLMFGITCETLLLGLSLCPMKILLMMRIIISFTWIICNTCLHLVRCYEKNECLLFSALPHTIFSTAKRILHAHAHTNTHIHTINIYNTRHSTWLPLVTLCTIGLSIYYTLSLHWRAWLCKVALKKRDLQHGPEETVSAKRPWRRAMQNCPEELPWRRAMQNCPEEGLYTIALNHRTALFPPALLSSYMVSSHW